jgi:Flp pilus assembly protein TadG
VAVEFALVLPLMLLLVLGGIDWGYYFFTGEIVANAAREGARAGSLVRGTTNACTSATGAIAVATNYLVRGRLISGALDPRLKAFDCAANNSCCTTPTVTGLTSPAVLVRVVYSARPSGAGSMSLTGFLPATLLPRNVTAIATMKLEP